MLELRSHQPTTKICFQVVPVERPGLVDVTTWVMLGSSLTMVKKLTFAFSFGITSVQQKSNAIAHNPLKDTKILPVSTHFLSCFESWSSFQVLLLAKATSHYRRRSHRLKKYQILRFKIAILHTKVTRQIIIRLTVIADTSLNCKMIKHIQWDWQQLPTGWKRRQLSSPSRWRGRRSSRRRPWPRRSLPRRASPPPPPSPLKANTRFRSLWKEVKAGG